MNCWYYDVSELEDACLFQHALSSIPWENRKHSIMKLRFHKDQRLSLGAGVLATYALRQTGAKDLTLEYGDYGKPYLAREGGIHFNLSHSGTLAVCAVSDHPVGIDVEQLREFPDLVADRCFTAEECLWMEKQTDRSRAAFRLWTRKESYMKLSGEGLHMNVGSFSVMPDSDVSQEYCFNENEIKAHLISVCTAQQQSAKFIEFNMKHDAVFCCDEIIKNRME